MTVVLEIKIVLQMKQLIKVAADSIGLLKTLNRVVTKKVMEKLLNLSKAGHLRLTTANVSERLPLSN